MTENQVQNAHAPAEKRYSADGEVADQKRDHSAPKVLLITTCRWFSAARLAMALDAAGFIVDAVCPKRHPLIGIRSISKVHRMRGFFPLASISSAISASQPNIVIPCDDLSALHLYDLHEKATQKRDITLYNLLERSLGPVQSFPTLKSRAQFLAMAKQEGIRVPDTVPLHTKAELRQWLEGQSFPIVLKADGTSGGEGVAIVHSYREAEKSFRRLKAPLAAAVVAKRAIFDRDPNVIRPFILRQKRTVSAQAFITGPDANIALACWQGRVLASIELDVLHTRKLKGPAAVLRRCESGKMLAAAEKIVGQLVISGMCGLDFVTDQATGEPVLLEINPRATQTCHLPLGTGHFLPAALYAAVTRQPLREPSIRTDSNMIALFPLEWQRDPASTFVHNGYHDVPWQEPSLVRRGIAKESTFTVETCSLIWMRLRAALSGQKAPAKTGEVTKPS